MTEADNMVVYVKPVPVSELEAEVQKELDGIDFVYAVCDSEGKPLALVDGERLAFQFARNHDYIPYSLN